jgi:hypothetical protein
MLCKRKETSSAVEIDETKYFKAKYNRGRMLNRQYDWMSGMLERGINKVRLFNVDDSTAATLCL